MVLGAGAGAQKQSDQMLMAYYIIIDARELRESYPSLVTRSEVRVKMLGLPSH